MLSNSKRILASWIILLMIVFNAAGQKKQSSKKSSQKDKVDPIECWLTTTDQSVLFQKQEIAGLSVNDQNPTIEIDHSKTYQTMDGFGYTLTGGSATLINSLYPESKKALLNELFRIDENNIGVSYLRLSIAASDLSDHVFSYNDLPEGETDVDQTKFSIDIERKDLIPVLKDIIAINPQIKILGSPWSAPKWMKTNNSFKGGSLKPEYFDSYAKYLVKYIEAMSKEGITIDAITIQNEPLHPGNNPSMFMSPEDQGVFLKKSLGPAFEKANIKTKIILYDHNADRIDYPISILNDPEAKKYADGSAFHLYGGKIEALSDVHKAHPDKNLYFTEQWVGAPGNFEKDLLWHVKTLMIGAPRNWCRNVLEWNLAADPNQDPHTDQGGCTQCLGAITIGSGVKKNVAYYIVAHSSKFVRPGSIRIESTENSELPNIAYKTTDGKTVLIVVNESEGEKSFNIKDKSKTFAVSLKNKGVATFVW